MPSKKTFLLFFLCLTEVVVYGQNTPQNVPPSIQKIIEIFPGATDGNEDDILTLKNLFSEKASIYNFLPDHHNYGETQNTDFFIKDLSSYYNYKFDSVQIYSLPCKNQKLSKFKLSGFLQELKDDQGKKPIDTLIFTISESTSKIEKISFFIDDDNDGVQNEDDDCPNVEGPEVTFGCPDEDSDGIRDSFDICKGTIPEEIKFVNTNGCPDNDKDGIINKKDECPNVEGPEATFGCPDEDSDGVRDSLDLCKGTIPEEIKFVNADGCPDNDGDGIINKKDECPRVSAKNTCCGCPDEDERHFDYVDMIGKAHLREPITCLEFADNKLFSGSKSGEVRLFTLNFYRKKGKSRVDYKKIFGEKLDGTATNAIFVEEKKLAITTPKKIQKYYIKDSKVFLDIERTDNNNYTEITYNSGYLFIKDENKWSVHDSKLKQTPVFMDSELQYIGVSNNKNLAYYKSSSKLEIIHQNPFESNSTQSFTISLEDTIKSTNVYKDTAWLLINTHGEAELVNYKCQRKFNLNIDNRKVNYVKTDDNLNVIALFFKDNTWAIWHKHSTAAQWKKMRPVRNINNNSAATYIEVSKDGNHFFVGNEHGAILIYEII